MERKRPGSSPATLIGLLLLAAGYGVLLGLWPELTGSALLDGVIGVGLGLYIASHPAAAAVDLLYLDRLLLERLVSTWSEIGWLALNLTVLAAGCLVTIAGATRLVG